MIYIIWGVAYTLAHHKLQSQSSVSTKNQSKRSEKLLKNLSYFSLS